MILINYDRGFAKISHLQLSEIEPGAARLRKSRQSRIGAVNQSMSGATEILSATKREYARPKPQRELHQPPYD